MGEEVKVFVEPGICGFSCDIRVKRVAKDRVEMEIMGSGCKQVQALGKELQTLSLKDLFLPITQNPVYLSAQKVRCHVSCAVPVAILKATEVCMEMALPKDVVIRVG